MATKKTKELALPIHERPHCLWCKNDETQTNVVCQIVPEDFDVYVPTRLSESMAMNADEALAKACKKLGLPILGGPSGNGWSRFSIAQKCPQRFFFEHVVVPSLKPAEHPKPLQVGAYYHAFQAFAHAHQLGPCGYSDGGLVSLEWRGKGRPHKALTIDVDAVDNLIAELKAMAASGTPDEPGPVANYILEAERLFEAHQAHWGTGREDITPLALEWLAEDPVTKATCRYDMVLRVGDRDPQFKPGSIIVRESKTASWMDEIRSEGWFLDGEILGEAGLWKSSGCEERFGKLTALVVDVVTKSGKVPKLQQVIVPPDLPAVPLHMKWLNYQNFEISMWAATGIYPQRFSACDDSHFGRCPHWDRCSHAALDGKTP